MYQSKSKRRGSLVFLLVVLMLYLFSAVAVASPLTIIGTANYDSDDDGNAEPYNLIYEGEVGGSGLVWLDFSNNADDWEYQVNWVANLDALLTVNIDPAYTVSWSEAWRLPSTVDGEYVWGYDGNTTAGYNITTSEMGHLFYTSLGNVGEVDTNNNLQKPFGLQDTGDFNNLVPDLYWSGTDYSLYSDSAWNFDFFLGTQGISMKMDNTDYVAYAYGIALRQGNVSASPVPEPSTLLLLGAGLVGLAGYGRKKLS